MTNKRINTIVDFLYSSNNSNEVPIRISISTGQYNAFDISKEALKELLEIFEKSVNIKDDLFNWRKKYE